jgi:hypothetical protein
VIDQARRVVHEIEVALPQDEVFEFFTDPRRLVRWIGLSASLSPVPRGRFRFEVQPGQFCEGGTRVRLAHHQLLGELRAIHDEGWATFLARLSATAAESAVPAYPPEGRP